MKKIRKNTFETNSSSTHALVIGNAKDNNDYVPFGNNLKIRFIDTDEEVILSTLKDKVSYLVSHIASWYKYNATNYEDLIDSIKMNYDFRRIEEYVNQKYGKQIVFPDKYDGDIEDIVNINHQLTSWGNTLNEILEDMVEREDLLGYVLENGNNIEFGRD